MAQNSVCILGTTGIQEVQRSHVWCRWCVGHPMLSKFAGKDPNWLVHFQIPDLLQNLFYVIWTTWPNDLVLQNVYLYGWSEFGLGSGGWHDRLTSDTMIIANCWQLFWMFLWDAFKEFSSLSHVRSTCDRSCWGDAIDWRQYSWIVSAIVGTHLGSWPGYYVFLIHLMYSLQGPGPFQRTHLGDIEIRLDEAFMDIHIDESIYHCHISFWQF